MRPETLATASCNRSTTERRVHGQIGIRNNGVRFLVMYCAVPNKAIGCDLLVKYCAVSNKAIVCDLLVKY